MSYVSYFLLKRYRSLLLLLCPFPFVSYSYCSSFSSHSLALPWLALPSSTLPPSLFLFTLSLFHFTLSLFHSPLLSSSSLIHFSLQHRYIYSNYGRDLVSASPPQGILKVDVLAGTESSWIGAADEYLGEPIFAKKKDARKYRMLD